MKRISINLKCEYSSVELDEKRDELSSVILGAHEVERRKADANKEYKESLEALYSRRDVLAFQIKSRNEIRPVECAIEFHKPVTGVKRIVRLDTGELVKDEPMTEEERQEKLFGEIDSLEKSFSAPDDREPPAEPTVPPEAA